MSITFLTNLSTDNGSIFRLIYFIKKYTTAFSGFFPSRPEQMAKSRSVREEDYDPQEEAKKKRKRQRSRRRAARKQENLKRSKHQRKKENSKRSKDQIKKENSKRSADQRKKENSKRTKDQIQKQNLKRLKEKRRMESSVYDVASPFPPTEKQVKLCGRILSNSIAALYAQQAPPPEISYTAVVADEVTSYTRPIIDFAMHEFRQQCNFRESGDFNFSKAAANKALNTLDKILLINEHYQLMFDFNVWDVLNPPSLYQLKQLSSRHPCQPISESLKKDVERYKN